MRDFESIDLDTLGAVTGGRLTQVDQIDPALIKGISDLAQAVVAVGQNLSATKQQSDGQLMQMMQMMMQRR